MPEGQSDDRSSAGFRFSPRANRAYEIGWQEWGAAAFERAAREDKPVLVAISAVWCHWCHVMDETSYSDPGLITTINRDYIPVRVDADERPDVDRRYNQGGWPSTVLLTPTGEVLVGATYIPPHQLQALLTEVCGFYHTNRADIQARIAELRGGAEAATARPAARAPALSEDVVTHLTDLVLQDFDPQHGGFGREPKFPHVEVLHLALERSCLPDGKALRDVVTVTLDAMRRGGIFDHVEGGFFRYSTTRDWSVPHFEKMLEDNAALLRLYLETYQVTGTDSYRETALDVMRYMETTLRDPNTGAFFGSQDALEEYYRLSGEERQRIAPPYVDPTVYADRNALAASAYFTAFAALGDERYRNLAVQLVEYLWSHLRSPDAGMCHYYRGEARLPGLLGDQLRMAEALLDAYQSTAVEAYLDNAAQLLDLVRRDFLDPQSGGFFDVSEQRAARAVAATARRERLVTDNALAAIQYLRLHHLTQDPTWRDLARAPLELFADNYKDYGLFAALYGRAVHRFICEPVAVTIVVGTQEPRVADLLYSSLHAYSPWKVVRTLSPVRDAERIRTAGFQSDPETAVYVCRDHTCLPPIGSADGVEEAVRTC